MLDDIKGTDEIECLIAGWQRADLTRYIDEMPADNRQPAAAEAGWLGGGFVPRQIIRVWLARDVDGKVSPTPTPTPIPKFWVSVTA